MTKYLIAGMSVACAILWLTFHFLFSNTGFEVYQTDYKEVSK